MVPIGTSAPFGCLAARARERNGFGVEDTHFAVQTAGVLAAALERLLVDEEQRLAALQDPLTGLPNRALILDHLRLALARSQRRPSTVAVFFVDLDRFKLINDSLGHQAGDHILMAVGAACGCPCAHPTPSAAWAATSSWRSAKTSAERPKRWRWRSVSPPHWGAHFRGR